MTSESEATIHSHIVNLIQTYNDTNVYLLITLHNYCGWLITQILCNYTNIKRR